jgi:hypothetical protein
MNKTWKGIFVDTTTKPMCDVSTWERILTTGCQDLHSVNDGEYGGWIITHWDKLKQTVSLLLYHSRVYTNGIMNVAGTKSAVTNM